MTNNNIEMWVLNVHKNLDKNFGEWYAQRLPIIVLSLQKP